MRRGRYRFRSQAARGADHEERFTGGAQRVETSRTVCGDDHRGRHTGGHRHNHVAASGRSDRRTVA